MATGLTDATYRLASRQTFALAAKRAIDIAGSALGLVLLAPVLPVVALLVRLEDGGPVIYRRRVVGRNGEFDSYKFRSMCRLADEMLGSDARLMREFARNYKLANDPRVTRIGRLLRTSSLDELPQLVNVLLGQMSLVGPRMITRAELAKYGESGRTLLTVRPGMTGYWQTEKRQRAPYEERVQMDMYYIRNWSLLFDLRILLKTPWAVIKGQGAC